MGDRELRLFIEEGVMEPESGVQVPSVVVANKMLATLIKSANEECSQRLKPVTPCHLPSRGWSGLNFSE
jgi:hypothetical protein